MGNILSATREYIIHSRIYSLESLYSFLFLFTSSLPPAILCLCVGAVVVLSLSIAVHFAGWLGQGLLSFAWLAQRKFAVVFVVYVSRHVFVGLTSCSVGVCAATEPHVVNITLLLLFCEGISISRMLVRLTG